MISEKNNSQDIHSDRSIRLFQFLRELTQLRSKITRSLDQYEKVLWFSDIPHEPECYCIAWNVENQKGTDDGTWLEIQKPKLKPAPKLPNELTVWIPQKDISDSSLEYPRLRDSISEDVTEVSDDGQKIVKTVTVRKEDRPEIVRQWQHYIQSSWKIWAQEHKRLKKIQEFYTDLFTVYQKQQRLGESYEVVLGLGCLTWQPTGSSQKVKRHVLSVQTSVNFDITSGRISVEMPAQGAKPILEYDMLEPTERPEIKEQQAIEKSVLEIGENFWSDPVVHGCLKGWVNTLGKSGDGRYEDVLTSQKECNSTPRINFAPALILRKRGERGLLQFFEEIIRQLKNGSPVPDGIKKIIEIYDEASLTSDESGGGDGYTISAPLEDEEVYFPLPANEEQKRIAQALNKRVGVLVQGPPGTGKSHTIVNLICHLLASGKKVLVTSHTARALKVLKNKFPDEIKNLCVTLLGDNQDALKGLEDSVQAINQKYNSWNPETNRRKIAELEKSLHFARKESAKIQHDLRAIRESETYSHPIFFENYSGTCQQIASQVATESPKYCWLNLEIEENQELPCSNSESVEVLNFIKEDKPSSGEFIYSVCDPSHLLPPSQFENFVSDEKNAQAELVDINERLSNPLFSSFEKLSTDIQSKIKLNLSSLTVNIRFLSTHSQLWIRTAIEQILSGQQGIWEILYNSTKASLDQLSSLVEIVSGYQISGLTDQDLSTVRVHAQQYLEYLNANGQPGWWSKVTSKIVKETSYLSENTRIDGRLCNTQETLHQLINWISTKIEIEKLKILWVNIVPVQETSLIGYYAFFTDLLICLRKVLDASALIEEITKDFALHQIVIKPNWSSSQDIEQLLNLLDAIQIKRRYSEAHEKIENLESKTKQIIDGDKVHPLIPTLLQSLTNRDISLYYATYRQIRDYYDKKTLFTKKYELYELIKSRCPDFISLIEQLSDQTSLVEKLADLKNAWRWSQAKCWLKKLSDPRREKQLVSDLNYYTQEIRKRMGEIAAEKAWGHCFTKERFNEKVRQHLQAWSQSVKKIGKGTGKYAEMHRKSARDHMEHCRPAIPAWIMPIYRVAESLKPGLDSFDVVIVDEASQSGPEALFLLYIAKKVVVVGDDKQISPDFIGIDREAVMKLRDMFLEDIPHKDHLGVDDSFFDQANIRYGGRIRLREHFRCMPEIIQFCNNLCYLSEPLIPLKQYGAGRLEPIVTRYVQDGYLSGESKVVNKPEAEAIVNAIKECCENPKYKGKSIGVISLLSTSIQAQYIYDQLVQELGPEEVEARHIVCGDAYDFQGDERDIIFLSMVTAPSPGKRIGTLTSQKDERRFNVAVSRAQEQLWLFHSATLSDLNSNCLRYKLLEYCNNPKLDSPLSQQFDINQLSALAHPENRSNSRPPDPFDSWFEVDVYLQIIQRGYRVSCQLSVAGYRIDLVVEGLRGKLAIECDGDQWHGPEQYAHDMARQRDLERCGWNFWRIRGSAYYQNPYTALEGLWKTLKDFKIYPKQEDHLCNSEETANVSLEAFYVKPKEYFQYVTPAKQNSPNLLDAENDDENVEKLAPSSLHIKDTSSVNKSSSIKRSDINCKPWNKWDSKPLKNPHTAKKSEIIAGLIDIIRAEGPMPCHRAYRVYCNSLGIQRIGQQIRSIFNKSITAAVREGRLVQENEYRTTDQSNKIVRLRGAPKVCLRDKGLRDFDEIPPSEFAELISHISQNNKALGKEEILREALVFYGFVRMTDGVKKVFKIAWNIFKK